MKDRFHCSALLRVVPSGTVDSRHERLLMFPSLLLAYAFVSFLPSPWETSVKRLTRKKGRIK